MFNAISFGGENNRPFFIVVFMLWLTRKLPEHDMLPCSIQLSVLLIPGSSSSQLTKMKVMLPDRIEEEKLI